MGKRGLSKRKQENAKRQKHARLGHPLPAPIHSTKQPPPITRCCTTRAPATPANLCPTYPTPAPPMWYPHDECPAPTRFLPPPDSCPHQIPAPPRPCSLDGISSATHLFEAVERGVARDLHCIAHGFEELLESLDCGELVLLLYLGIVRPSSSAAPNAMLLGRRHTPRHATPRHTTPQRQATRQPAHGTSHATCHTPQGTPHATRYAARMGKAEIAIGHVSAHFNKLLERIGRPLLDLV